MKRAWIAIMVAAALASGASAGTVRTRYWPMTLSPQELVKIPVVMDVGLWMDIALEGDAIKLEPAGSRRFEGSADIRVRCNFNATLMYSIAPTGVLNGRYSVFPERMDIDAPGKTTTVCARLMDPDFAMATAHEDVNVAVITVSVIPRP